MANQNGSTSQSDSADATFEVLRQELLVELNELVRRLQALSPEYTPPQFSRQRLLALAEQSVQRLSPEVCVAMLERLRGLLASGLLDVETIKGLWYLMNYFLRLQVDIFKRRVTGEYETDPWGLDWEMLETFLPFVNFLYGQYWRVETTGIDNVPSEGGALLVSNHSGQLPWDAVMVGAAVWNEHPSQRLVRALFSTWIASLPFVSTMFIKMGHVPATVENGQRLLAENELVAAFPEGNTGVSKVYTERYKLRSFGRGGFAKMALGTQAPIIPVSVVGAEEIYPTITQSDTLARLSSTPYFPITPTFPWLGPLGLVPLPTKWYIDFGELIATDGLGADAATNIALISELTQEVRTNVQGLIDSRLESRRSVFRG